MRFVPVEAEAQRAVLVAHRSRGPLVRPRTRVVNAPRGHRAEFGIVAPRGIRHAGRPRARVEDEGTIPGPGRTVLGILVRQLEQPDERIAQAEAAIVAWRRADPVSRRLAEIPGIGPLTAGATVATVPDPPAFRSGRAFAARLGLAPRQRSTGGKERPGRIGRPGDRPVRRPLIVGARPAPPRSREVRANARVRGPLRSPRPARGGARRQDGAHRPGGDGRG